MAIVHGTEGGDSSGMSETDKTSHTTRMRR